MRMVKKGRRISRASWREPGKYIYWAPAGETTLPDGRTVALLAHALFYRPTKGEHPHGQVEPWQASADAMAGADWYVVDEEAEP